jgi:hypothetical protein
MTPVQLLTESFADSSSNRLTDRCLGPWRQRLGGLKDPDPKTTKRGCSSATCIQQSRWRSPRVHLGLLQITQCAAQTNVSVRPSFFASAIRSQRSSRRIEVKLGYDERALSPFCKPHRQGCTPALYLISLEPFFGAMHTP